MWVLITYLIGSFVRARTAAKSCAPICGLPPVSMTATPSRPMMNPAFEVSPELRGVKIS